MNKQRDQKSRRGEKGHQQQERKPYVKPHLTEYGHIEKLTEGASGTQIDGITRRS
jgi:hypothetical protein